MTRITISMNEQQKAALRLLSEIEFREPAQQAALIIRLELERRGLLEPQPVPELPTLPKPRKGAKEAQPA